ncbi:MAG TPA: hypothetical protein VF170_10055, partial [Planctomycetaceae bacterium]
PVELIDADLATVTAEADKVFRIGEPEPWLLHLELQSGYDPTLPDRMLLYSTLLTHRHAVPARSVALLLRPKADGPAMTGSVLRAAPAAQPYLEFRYETLRLWQVPVESVIAAGIGTLPLAPLAAGAAPQLNEVIDRMDRRVRSAVESAEASDLWAATYVLLGLSYPLEVGRELLRRVRTMEESVTYQEILNKGERKGEARGILEGARRVLLTFGSKRFGPPAPETRDEIEAIHDFDRLERLTERVPEVSGWDELLHDA